MATKTRQFGLFEPAPRETAPGARDRAQPPAPASAPPQNVVATDRVLTVGELTGKIKGLLEGEFPRVVVSGELSNFRRQTSGHLYFTLKDGEACLGGVLWRQAATRLGFDPKDGLEVVCHGRVELYAPHGKYQLIAERMEPLGAGALALAFEQLKARLEKEGLFEPARKRPLPFLPRKIGVVTSPTGAALRDFLRVLHLRYPGLPVLIAPAKVQGDGAAAEIVEAIRRLSAREDVDVVVITRGGGSMEDLWAFNEEAVVRAIVACRVPVVTGIGHEIDYTIADFASDRRAPTPTGAAEILAPVREELRAASGQLFQRMRRGMLALVIGKRSELLRLRPRLGDPRRAIADLRLGLSETEDRLQSFVRQVVDERRRRLHALRERLDGASPRTQLLERLRALGELGLGLERAGRRAIALEVRRLALEKLRARLAAAGTGALQGRHERLRVSAARLDAISPQRVFERGYSMTRKLATGELVRLPSDAVPGDAIEVVLGLGGGRSGVEEQSIEAVVRKRGG
ncbi:MAG: exodeoxyribonuclease VII large subunit [Deltaproteobacteria bacterium]